VTTEIDEVTQFALTLPVDQRAQMASAPQLTLDVRSSRRLWI